MVEESHGARKQEVGGQRSHTTKLSRKQGKEVYFSRQVEPSAAQKAVTPPFQTRGVAQITKQHEITQAEIYFRKYSTPWMTYSSIMSLEI